MTAASKPRVLHCLWSGSAGGAERAVFLLARGQMEASEFAPAMLFAQSGGRYCEQARAHGLPVVGLDVPTGRALWRVPSIRAGMRAFDILHFHSVEPLLMLAGVTSPGACRVFTRRGGTPDPSARKRPVNRLAGTLLRRSFHGISGNTAHAAACARELFQLEDREIHITYNGLDFDSLAPVRSSTDVRAELGLRPGDFVVGTAGKLTPLKRVDRLIRAVDQIGDERLRLVVLGDGPDRGRLEALARQGPPGAVVLAGARDHIGDYLQVMDAFCLASSDRESFGNATVEAMGAGLPAIVFRDSSGMVEHIEDERTGFVVGEPAELAVLLGRLMNDPDACARVGRAGQAHVRARYTVARAVAAYDDLYRSALARCPRPPAAR